VAPAVTHLEVHTGRGDSGS